MMICFRPSVVDALAFGYLAPLLNAPLPNAVLQNHLKACRNLVMFCRRIQDVYFPLSPEGMYKLLLRAGMSAFIVFLYIIC